MSLVKAHAALVRPTALGLAMLNAAVKNPKHKAADKAMTLVMKNDRPDAPTQSEYNRTMQDGIRVSAKTLASMS